MKKLILLFIPLVALSCIRREAEDLLCEYTVINQSSKRIKVEAYHRFEPTITPIVTILNPGDTLTKREKREVCLGGYVYLFGEGTQTDSLKVIFYADTRTKVQFFIENCGPNKLNPLDFCVYNGSKETFVFTEEHFENAEPCSDCG